MQKYSSPHKVLGRGDMSDIIPYISYIIIIYNLPYIILDIISYTYYSMAGDGKLFIPTQGAG